MSADVASPRRAAKPRRRDARKRMDRRPGGAMSVPPGRHAAGGPRSSGSCHSAMRVTWQRLRGAADRGAAMGTPPAIQAMGLRVLLLLLVGGGGCHLHPAAAPPGPATGGRPVALVAAGSAF